jgi:hypothetical protein
MEPLKLNLIEGLSNEIRTLSSDEVEAEKAVTLLNNSISIFELQSNKEQLVEYVQKQIDEHRNGEQWYAEHFVLAGDAFLKYVSHG